MDGPLLLTRVVRKAVVSFEAINAQGDASTVQVDCLAPELTPRPLIGILCNDLLVLCRDPSEGQEPTSPVDLWAVLRMQTLPQPASIVHGNGIIIHYFNAGLFTNRVHFCSSSTSGQQGYTILRRSNTIGRLELVSRQVHFSLIHFFAK